MQHLHLLPHSFKRIGWFIFITTLVAYILNVTEIIDSSSLKCTVFAFYHDQFLGDSQHFSFITTEITQTVLGILFIIGAMMVSFSKEKIEDEFISRLRLNALLWAVWVNYILLILAFIFIYGMAFLDVMLYNMFTLLILFIIKFNFDMYKPSNSQDYEK